MKIEIEELGPIRKSELDLGNLTVFYGPPDSGKSYVLKRVYAETMLLDDFMKTALSSIISVKIMERFREEVDLALAEGRNEIKAEFDLLSLLREAIRTWSESFADFGEVVIKPSLEILEKSKLEYSKEVGPIRTKVEGTKAVVEARLDEYLNISDALRDALEGVVPQALNSFSALFKKVSGFKSTCYCSYGRGALNLLASTFKEVMSTKEMESVPNLLTSLLGKISETILNFLLSVRVLVSFPSIRKTASDDFIKIMSPETIILLKLMDVYSKEIKETEFFDVRFEGANYLFGNTRIPIKKASAYANELFSLLSLIGERESGLILIEEPESQLHPETQVLVAMWLYYLALKNTVVITTHSPVLMAALVLLHEGLKKGRDPCKLVDCKGCRELKPLNSFKLYYFEKKDGFVKIVERETREIIGKGMNGATKVARKLSLWYSGLEVEI